MDLSFAAMRYGTVAIAQKDAVAIIRLQRPARLNAYVPEMGEDLVDAFRATASDEGIRAVVLTGEGRAFCAGADRDCFTLPPGPSGLRIGEEAFVRGFASEIRNHPKLTIAAFHGATVGIGVSMSLGMDIRLAATDAQLKLNFAENGIMPGFGATYLLPHLIGLGRAKRLLLCEPTLTAADALAMGLVDEICPPALLVQRACMLGDAAAGLTANAVSGIKQALNAGVEGGFAAALVQEAASDLRKEPVHC